MNVDYQLHINGLKGLKPFLQNIMLIENYDGMGELDAKEVGETFDLAIEALEKQMPKKPRKYQGVTLECPACGSIKTHSAPYCKYCGQALDWSDTE